MARIAGFQYRFRIEMICELELAGAIMPLLIEVRYFEYYLGRFSHHHLGQKILLGTDDKNSGHFPGEE